MIKKEKWTETVLKDWKEKYRYEGVEWDLICV